MCNLEMETGTSTTRDLWADGTHHASEVCSDLTMPLSSRLVDLESIGSRSGSCRLSAGPGEKSDKLEVVRWYEADLCIVVSYSDPSSSGVQILRPFPRFPVSLLS